MKRPGLGLPKGLCFSQHLPGHPVPSHVGAQQCRRGRLSQPRSFCTLVPRDQPRSPEGLV